jgi:hypothetical protein
MNVAEMQKREQIRELVKKVNREQRKLRRVDGGEQKITVSRPTPRWRVK